MFKPLLKILIITCTSLLVVNTTTAFAAPTCFDLLSVASPRFRFIDFGATALVFRRAHKAFKVYYAAEGADYSPTDGYDLALNEASLLTGFHKLIEEAGATEFRPLKFHRALKAEDIGLEVILEQRLRDLSKTPEIPMNGVLASEFVEGRLLDEILRDPLIDEVEKIQLVEKFNQALVKMEGVLNKTGHDQSRPLNIGWGRNQLHNNDTFYFDNAGQDLIPFNMTIKLGPDHNTPNSQRNISLNSVANIIVDSNGFFVLIDPN